MTRMLLAAAASLAVALSAGGAQAQQWSGSDHHRRDGGFTGSGFNGCGVSRGGFDGRHDGGNHDGHGHRGGGGRNFCSTDVVMDWYGGEWALWNNRSWEPTSYNDWWHENPARAYPAWMRRNQDCARKWYSGDVLTC